MTPSRFRRASISDIATAAGVSVATVSRSFSRAEQVRPDTLARIHEAARELDYRPHRSNRVVRSSRSRAIGMVLPTLCNAAFAECLEGAERRAQEQGYRIVVSTSLYNPVNEQAAVQRLLDLRVEGMILNALDSTHPAGFEALAHAGIPYVLAYNESRVHPSVSIDNRAAAAQVIDSFAAFGHRKIAFVSGPLPESDRARALLAGTRRQAARLGLPRPAHVTMPSHIACDRVRLRSVLAGPAQPSGLFCSNDLLAASVLAVLAEEGVRVPGDISLCGFDGMALGALLRPSLTSLEQPNRTIGEQACLHLLARMTGNDVPALSLTLSHRLVPGETLGAVAIPLPFPKRDIP